MNVVSNECHQIMLRGKKLSFRLTRRPGVL